MTLTDRLTHLLRGLALEKPISSPVREVGTRILDCLPPAMRRALARHHRALIVHAKGERAALELVRGLESEQIGEIDTLPGSSLTQVIGAHGKEQHSVTELRLPAEAVLKRAISFPAQVRSNLPQVIRYELDRLTPFQSDDVLFDFAVQKGAKNANRVYLDLAFCRRDVIATWIERMKTLGSPLDRVTWEGAWAGANLLPPENRPPSRGVRLSWNALLLILGSLLAVAILVTPIWQKQQVAEVLASDLTDVRKRAIAVDELRQELERARQGSTLVLQKKMDQPPILDLIQELTDRLPDDTWIQNMEINADQVDIRGESGQATALIAILEQAPGIEGVSFKSPVTQIARTGKDRFNLSFRYGPQGEE